MLSTTITPVNFNSFSKSFSKKTKLTKFPIPLLTTQEILAQTLNFRNAYDLKKHFSDKQYTFVINQDNHINLSKRFHSILLKFNFALDEKESFFLFSSIFGLEESRKLSIVDILKELNAIRDMKDSQMGKLHFSDINDKVSLDFSYDYNDKEKRSLLLRTSNYENEIIDIKNRYQNISKNTSMNSMFLDGLNNLNPSKDIQHKFLELLDILFTYSSEELIKTFNSNRRLFLVHCPKMFIISLPIRKNHILSNGNIFIRKYALLEKSYILNKVFNFSEIDGLLILNNLQMKTDTHNKYFSNSRKNNDNKTKKFTFNTYEKAIQYLVKINSNNKYVVVPINELVFGYDSSAFHFGEYFGLENKKIYKYSMINKEKIFI